MGLDVVAASLPAGTGRAPTLRETHEKVDLEEVRRSLRNVLGTVVGARARQPFHIRRQHDQLRLEERCLFAKGGQRRPAKVFVGCPDGAVEIREALVRNSGGADGHGRCRTGCQRRDRRNCQEAQLVPVLRWLVVEENRVDSHSRIQAEAQLGKRCPRLDLKIDIDGQLAARFDDHFAHHPTHVGSRRVLLRFVSPGPAHPLFAFHHSLPVEQADACCGERDERSAATHPATALHRVRPRRASRRQPNETAGCDDQREAMRQVQGRGQARQDVRARQAQVGDAGDHRQQVQRGIEHRPHPKANQRQADRDHRQPITKQCAEQHHEAAPEQQQRRRIEQQQDGQREQPRRFAEEQPVEAGRRLADALQHDCRREQRQPNHRRHCQQPAAD